MKGTRKAHIFLNFKMTSRVGRELLRYCAVLRRRFSSDLKASICCSSHLKLVPPLRHHLLAPAGAKGRRWTCLGLVCCSSIAGDKGEGFPVGDDSPPKSFRHDAFVLVHLVPLAHLIPLDYQGSGPSPVLAALVLASQRYFKTKDARAVLAKHFPCPDFGSS